MQAIRQIIETKKLKGLIDIPDDFSSETVEIIVFPVLPIEKKPFDPEQFFGVSRLTNIDQQLEAMRNEWER
ncbi:MAG: hypothetical protein HOP02_05860 [Methylococcaceae bacterium]|nr:hypothetical protein [Methylococcaceae bacterium]